MSLISMDDPKGGRAGAVARLRGAMAGLGGLMQQPAVRRALPSLILAGVSALAVLTWLALRETPRTALFPGLAEAERARVIEVLKGQSIDASLDDATGEVTVPAGDYHRARLALAAEGLPQSVPDGSSLITDLPMGASQAVEGTRLRQAQELDLARTISEIGAVVAARVHLALPEKSAFLRDSHPPSAAVFLTLASGRTLDPGQVEAIVHLVSSSVPGMARGDVTVVDERGRLLSHSDGGEDGLATDTQMRHRLAFEDLMRRRIEAVLAPVVGPENLSVQVTAAMDFTRREITEERVDPDGNALRSEQLSQTVSSSPSAGGIPGAVSNTPPSEAALTATAPPTEPGVAPAPGQDQSTGATRNYEVSRTVASTRPEVGQLTRISAAIVLRAPQEGAMDATALADLRRLTETAIGLDPARGDSLEIIIQPFATPPVAETAPAMDLAWVPGALREVGLIFALAVIGFGVLRPLLMRQTAPLSQGLDLASGLTTVEVDEGETLKDVEARLNRRQKDLAASVLGSQASRAEKLAALRQLAASDPYRIATVLHRMMKSEIDSVQ